MMAIDMVTEEIASNLEEAAVVTRKLSGQGAGFFLGGLVLGAAVGFYFGHRWNREKLRAEAFEESQREVAKIREAYRAGTTVVETPKPTIEEVIEGKGYLSESTVEAIKKPSDKKKPATRRATRPPVPVEEPPPLVVEEAAAGMWDYEKELEGRTDEAPYVIHQNEFNHAESGYTQVTYTYYATDDVLVGEDERPIPHGDLVVGQNNLKWGHGADDIDVVFVRNDKLELEMEICRVYRSYEETVLGLQNDDEN
jgi:hypothetical protein